MADTPDTGDAFVIEDLSAPTVVRDSKLEALVTAIVEAGLNSTAWRGPGTEYKTREEAQAMAQNLRPHLESRLSATVRTRTWKRGDNAYIYGLKVKPS